MLEMERILTINKPHLGFIYVYVAKISIGLSGACEGKHKHLAICMLEMERILTINKTQMGFIYVYVAKISIDIHAKY